MREIATATGAGRVTIRDRAAREGWPFREEPCAGRPRRLYEVSALPADIRRRLEQDPPEAAAGSDPARSDCEPHGGQAGAASAPLPPSDIPDDTPIRRPGDIGEGAGAVPAPSNGSFNAPSTAVEAGFLVDSDGVDLEALYWALPEARRARADAKLVAVDAALAIRDSDKIPMLAACERAAAAEGCRWSASALMASWRRIRGLPRHRRAMALADRRTGRVARAECDPEAWEFFKADYLRLEEPPAAACHRRLQRVAESRDWAVPASPAALLRRLEAECPREAIVLARKGRAALQRMIPPQQRLRPRFSLDAVNCDGFRFDNFVAWHPDPGRDPIRPVGVFWQDLHSGELLSFRIAETENADSYRLSFHDVLRDFGIPGDVYADNGRGIAAKHLTGGAVHRFRFKVKAEEPTGLITQLVGPKHVHWTTPYHGQSKPIERAFKEFAEDLCRSPALRGSWTGNRPDAKPENYRSRAVPREDFLRAVAEFVRLHNARRGRRGRGMDGRSFDEVFAAGWDPARVARPSEAQLARWLLAAEGVTADYRSGAVTLLKTAYWAPEMAAELAGRPKERRRVVVRFDPENLALPVTVERLDGSLIARAAPRGAVAFDSKEAAEERAREQRRLDRAAREALQVQKRMDDADLDRLLADAPLPQPAQLPPANVVAGAFGREPERPAAEEGEDLAAAAERRVLEAIGWGGGKQ
ncbi:MAG: Mu transposase C-terminal domain-containing protein [Bryobacterales bacterium]|nr:Mu transposase C-terminal domain-containing protein [Bryobacterales bacterium]